MSTAIRILRRLDATKSTAPVRIFTRQQRRNVTPNGTIAVCSSKRTFHSCTANLLPAGDFNKPEENAKTFASENPDLVSGEEKIFFDDFEPGEEIPLVPLPPFDDGSGKVLASPELKDLADRVCSLNIIEIHQLTMLMNDHFGFDDSMDMSMGFGGGGGGGSAPAAEAAPVEEKTAFDIKLMSFDAKSKIKVIKEVRAITGLGLKEAKELVEGAPKALKKGIKKEEAEEIKAKLEGIGAVAEIE